MGFRRTSVSAFLALSLGSLLSLAPAFSSEFEGGVEDQFRLTRYSDDQIQLEIQNKIKVACKGDRCELASVTNRGESFTVSVSAGVGNNNQWGGNGGVVIVDGSGRNNSNNNEPYIGVTLKYLKGNCTQSVNVPQSLYIAMNTYLYRLINEDGSTERSFSPAQQTMILFYTTILKQASGCTVPQ
ncbi:MAG: hypothetical protein RJB38_1046 [Pseudomonadota bacterium]|jgi:hypothetical protein